MIRLGKAQINGSYSVSTPSSPNTTFNDFQLNLYADLVYSHNILFHAFKSYEEKKPTFGKIENHSLSYKKVKGRYTDPPSELAEELKNYLSPKLLGAVVSKIYEEVEEEVEHDDATFQIKSEIAFRYRNHIADRLEKAINDAFGHVHENNCTSVHYYDKTNFHVSTMGFLYYKFQLSIQISYIFSSAPKGGYEDFSPFDKKMLKNFWRALCGFLLKVLSFNDKFETQCVLENFGMRYYANFTHEAKYVLQFISNNHKLTLTKKSNYLPALDHDFIVYKMKHFSRLFVA